MMDKALARNLSNLASLSSNHAMAGLFGASASLRRALLDSVDASNAAAHIRTARHCTDSAQSDSFDVVFAGDVRGFYCVHAVVLCRSQDVMNDPYIRHYAKPHYCYHRVPPVMPGMHCEFHRSGGVLEVPQDG